MTEWLYELGVFHRPSNHRFISNSSASFLSAFLRHPFQVPLEKTDKP